MSKEATYEDKRGSMKEDIKEEQSKIQSSKENINHNVESNPKDSDRQVAINEDVITSVEETSFMDETKDSQPNNDINKVPINNTHSASTDDIISIHDVTEDENIENQNSSRPKCLKCMSEIFECTIWFFRSMASSIRSRLQNCCCFNKETVDIQNRKFDDDGEYWNGNVMNSDEEGVIRFSSDSREDGNKTKETFKQDLIEVRNNSKVNEGFVDISIKADRTASEHKPVNETRLSNGNDTKHRNSTTSVVCHVNLHNESHENKDVTNVANGGVASSGSKVCHDSDRGGRDSVHSKVHSVGPSGGHNVGDENDHTGGFDGGHSGGHDGGHSGGHDGGHSGGHDGGSDD